MFWVQEVDKSKFWSYYLLNCHPEYFLSLKGLSSCHNQGTSNQFHGAFGLWRSPWCKWKTDSLRISPINMPMMNPSWPCFLLYDLKATEKDKTENGFAPSGVFYVMTERLFYSEDMRLTWVMRSLTVLSIDICCRWLETNAQSGLNETPIQSVFETHHI